MDHHSEQKQIFLQTQKPSKNFRLKINQTIYTGKITLISNITKFKAQQFILANKKNVVLLVFRKCVFYLINYAIQILILQTHIPTNKHVNFLIDKDATLINLQF